MDVLILNSTRKEICVNWMPPTGGWFKCNADGSSKANGAMVACGGVIRNDAGDWVTGFSLRLKSQDSLSAEISGIIAGLDLAWDKGICRLQLNLTLRLQSISPNMVAPMSILLMVLLIHSGIDLTRDGVWFCGLVTRKKTR